MAYTNIDDPELYFQVKTYTGNSTDDTAITLDGDENMQPDLTWIKERNGTNDNTLFDSVRGATKRLRPNAQAAEDTQANQLKSFDSDGFTLGNLSAVNNNGQTYVAWNWKAGGSASSNSDGDITSNVSANTTAGFSVVTYTGNGSADATVGHGLGTTISWLLLKNRDDSENWWNYHVGLSNPSTKAILLNSTNAEFTPGTSAFNPSGFSTSLFSLKNDNASNSSGDDYVAWIWSEKKGFSKFGSYTGNNNSNGTFVYTGFRPAFLMVKGSNESNQHWAIFDNKRDPINKVTQRIQPSSSDAESGGQDIDFLSNGIKFRVGGDFINGSYNYIYMAFAESPFVNSKGIPTNAR